MKPYVDNNISDNKFIRKFDSEISQDELVWHRDHHDRYITVIKNKNWMIQLDDEFPEKLEYNNVYYISKEIYHRLIKGDGDLLLSITEDK